MKCPEDIIEIMQEYLDDELDEQKKVKLREHLSGCRECQTIFNELVKTISFVNCTSAIQAPDHFTEKVMANLPKEKKKIWIQRWLRNHPLMAAASLLIILMLGVFFSTWSENREFSFSKQPNLIVKNNMVIVPKGRIVKGDIIVRNGKLEIEGEVKGNVTVINGKEYMASAGKVTGYTEVENVDWIWYYIKKISEDVFSLFDNRK